MRKVSKFASHFYQNQLYRNSFWLMAGSFVMAGLGFFYWLIAARLYTPDEIGLSATFLSVAAIVNSIATLGFNNTIMRYLPTSETKEKKINTSFTIISLTALLVGGIYLVMINYWTPPLSFLVASIPTIALVLFFFPMNMLNTITDSVFTAYRESEWVFVSNVTQSVSKLLVLLLLPAFGAWGIINSNIVAVVLAVLVCLFLINKRFAIHFKLLIDMDIVQQVRKYAFGSYLSALIGGLPSLLLPIIITTRISAEQTAYFYMPNMIATLLTIIPTMISRSYFTESSHEDGATSMRKPLLLSYAIIIPLTLLTILLGKEVLNLFGHNYASGGYNYLVLVSISVMISVVNYFLNTRLLVLHRLKGIVFATTIGSVLYLGLAWWLTPLGLEGVGIAAIASQIVSALALIALR